MFVVHCSENAVKEDGEEIPSRAASASNLHGGASDDVDVDVFFDFIPSYDIFELPDNINASSFFVSALQKNQKRKSRFALKTHQF